MTPTPAAGRASRRTAVVGAIVVGSFATVIMLIRVLHEPGWPTDLDPLHFAARSLVHGRNPYDAVGPGKEFQWDWPLFYPLSTVLLVMPLAWMPVALARVVFAAASGSLMGYAMCRDGYWRLPFMLSAAFLIAIWRSQWSPLVTASYFVPWAAVFLAAKPNLALPFLAGVRTRRQLIWLVASGALVLVVATAVRPSWITGWIAALRTKQYVSAPITNPAGWRVLLGLVRWRRPEARLLVTLACVPQTPSLYDLLPLFLVPRTMRQAAVLAVLTHALFLIVVALGPYPNFNDYSHQLERVATFVVWLPALAMVLVRPNVARDTDADEPAVSLGLRGRLSRLARLDAALLATTLAASSLLIWVVMVTRRA